MDNPRAESRTGSDAVEGICLHNLFEHWADEDPDAPAIVSEEHVLTYGDVENWANRLAHRIRLRWISPESDDLHAEQTVGIYLNRSMEAVVAILAVLKAGAAYVPMDPSTTPVDRATHIATSASISALITSPELEKKGRSIFSGPILSLKYQQPVCSDPPLYRLSPQETLVRPKSLCYILYTSGTTGFPKGVMTEHRNVVAFLEAFNKVVAIQRSDRIFQGFALGFDGSVEEMWMAFSNGATLAVDLPGEKRIGDDLADWLNAMHVTVHSTVPTSLSMINSDLEHVRLLIVSGETCTMRAVEKWATPERRMLNVYGPTEATVNTTCFECRPDKPVTIGFPLHNYKLLILDEDFREVNVGEAGELFIGGPTIARGYLNAPNINGKSFIYLTTATQEEDTTRIKAEIITAPSQGNRYYRTGDLVRRLESGQLDFLGRIDNQVKIRGYRVELSEIEAVVTEDSNVSRAVATLVQRGEMSSSIALYVTYRGNIDRAVLMERLQKKLPPYMIPTFLEQISQFPTLPSGKVDHSKLPMPSQVLCPATGAISLCGSSAPRTALEQHVAQAFMQVLGLAEPPSVEACFFTSFGGDSLTAARVVNRLREDFGYEVGIRDIYSSPTVQELAALIKKSRQEPRMEGAVESKPECSKVESEPPRVSSKARCSCHFFQALVLVLLYGFHGIPYMIAMVTGFYMALVTTGKEPFSWTLLWLILASILVHPLMIVFSLAVKWTVIGRYRPGNYPLWGAYYFRFWIVDKFQTIGVSRFAGTPWMSLYYWLMGAKVGSRCVLNTAMCSCFDVVTIGDDTSIGAQTQLLGYRIEDGLLKIGRVDIGSQVFVGIHSYMGLNVRIGNKAKIDDLTAIHDEQDVCPGQELRGSPAAPAKVSVPAPAVEKATRATVVKYAIAQWFVWQMVGITTFVAGGPSIVLGLWMFLPQRLTWRFLVLPSLPVLAALSACFVYAAFYRSLSPKVTAPRNFSVYSIHYLRRWYLDALMAITRTFLHPLYTTIYLPLWLRLMGTQIGEWAEISTVSWLAPDLTVLGPQSFFADGSIIGGHRVYCGTMTTATVTIGKRSFVGNSAIIPTGSAVSNNCLLGVLSAPPEPPTEIPEGSEWIGNPAFRLLHRNKVEGFGEHETHRPTLNLVCQRLLVDFFRVWIPLMIQIAGLTAAFGIFLLLFKHYGVAVSVSLIPPLIMGLQAVALLLIVALRRILIWRFRPIIRPLWSMFVWINELINGAYETVMAPIIAPLLGTPFCVPPLRWIGCNIGRNCWIGTTLFSEFDLVNIGSDTVLNAGVIVQNHLFEDRIMKASSLYIGDNCNIGNMSVILYDSNIGNHATIASLSLVMKGETIPSRGTYAGIPSQRACDVV